MDRRSARAVAIAAVFGVLAGCAGDEPDGEVFCGRLIENQALLTGAITTDVDVELVVDRFRQLEQVAPEAIREQWAELRQLVEAAAATTAGGDDTAELTEQAWATERAAADVADWVQRTCGVTLRPATTTGPMDDTSTTSTPG